MAREAPSKPERCPTPRIAHKTDRPLLVVNLVNECHGGQKLTMSPNFLEVLHDLLGRLLQLFRELGDEFRLWKRHCRPRYGGLVEEHFGRDGAQDGVAVALLLGQALLDLGYADLQSVISKGEELWGCTYN